MQTYIKRFDKLSTRELYQILKLRVDVFVVEQSCPYEEIDNLDYHAIHVYFKEDDEIIAYLRILDKGVESEDVAIGRVISVKRRCGIGSKLLMEGIKAAKENFKAEKIYIEAQSYARKFYENLGFKQISEKFLLDDIPHIKMELIVD